MDVDVFEEAALTARRARHPAVYRAAIDLYTQELLPEDRYEHWAEARREELRSLYLALLVELAGLHEERDEPELAIEALRKAIAWQQITATDVACDDPCRTATLDPYPSDPSRLLAANRKHKAIITSGVQDKAGNALAQNLVWTFTTRSS